MRVVRLCRKTDVARRVEMFQPGSDFGICRKSYWVTGAEREGAIVCTSVHVCRLVSAQTLLGV